MFGCRLPSVLRSILLVALLAAVASAGCSDETDSSADTGSQVADAGADADTDPADADAVDATDTMDDGAGSPDSEPDPDGSDEPDGSEPVEPPPPRPIPESVADCFPQVAGSSDLTPDYVQFSPTMARNCAGTNHQAILGVQKLVFFGDSVTQGTFPSRPEQYFRTLVTQGVRERFGEDVVVENYAKFGARTDDLLTAEQGQFRLAFPDVEPLTTLVVFTIGGNDVFRWAEDFGRGKPQEDIDAMVERAITDLRNAMDWLMEPGRFPNGVYVIFSNAYEFTDGTGDVTACGLASTIGLREPWPEGRGPLRRFAEAYMEIAVETQTDMVFLLESFCGHGLLAADETGPCYLGPETEVWFDVSCIHPNPAGHQQIADMVLAVVDE